MHANPEPSWQSRWIPASAQSSPCCLSSIEARSAMNCSAETSSTGAAFLATDTGVIASDRVVPVDLAGGKLPSSIQSRSPAPGLDCICFLCFFGFSATIFYSVREKRIFCKLEIYVNYWGEVIL